MLTAHVPMALALLATALMAIVIFAPDAARTNVTMSAAPPLPPAPFSAFESRHASADWSPRSAALLPTGDPFAPPADRDRNVSTWAAPRDEPVAPFWPALVDPRAASCGASDRIALADALGAVRAPWADAILQRALDDELDPVVREAVAAVLRTTAEAPGGC